MLILTLPNTLLVSRHYQWAILLENDRGHAKLVARQLYTIPYYGYRLDVGILPFERVSNNTRLIVQSLPHRATLALIQC